MKITNIKKVALNIVAASALLASSVQPTFALMARFSVEEGTPANAISQAGQVSKVKVGKNDCGARNGFDDCKNNRERAELTSVGDKTSLSSQPANGFTYRAKIFFPKDFTAPRGGMGITVYQLKVPGAHPAMDLFLRNSGDLRVKMDHSFKLGTWDKSQSASREPVIISAGALRGKWQDIQIKAFWSDDHRGRLAIFVNGRRVFSYNGPNLLRGNSIYVKHGIYRWDVTKDPNRGATTVMFKDVSVS